METVVAESKLYRALQYKLLPRTTYIILPGRLVRIFRECSRTSEGAFKVVVVSDRITSVTVGIKLTQFNILAVLPIVTPSKDEDRE